MLDSLKLELKKATHDSTRVKILHKLGVNGPIEDNFKYTIENLKLSKKNALAAENEQLKMFYLNQFAKGLENIAYIGYNSGDLLMALDFWHKSLKISEYTNDKEGIASAISNLGAVYYSQGNMNEALNYFTRSLKINEVTNDRAGNAYLLSNIGNIYLNRESLDTALNYFQKSLQVSKEINDKNGIALALNNIGGVYEYRENKDEALKYYTQSLKIAEEIQDRAGEAFYLNNIASIYRQKGQLNEALDHATRSLEVSRKQGGAELIRNSAYTLRSVYLEQKKYKDAFEMYDVYVKMRDSINNETAQKEAVKKQMQYEYEKKNLEAKAEQDKKDIVASEELKQRERERNYFIAGFGLVIILALFIFRGYRQKQKANAIITEQKNLVEEKQKEIIDSIHYAKRIQRALITPEKYIDRKLNDLQK